MAAWTVHEARHHHTIKLIMQTSLMNPDRHGQSRQSARANNTTHQLILEKEANLDALVENLDGLVWSIDRNMRYIIVNTALRKVIQEMTGIDPKPGDKLLDILALLDPSKAKECKKMYQLGFKGESQRFRQQYIIKGKTTYFDISINPIFKGTEITGLSCFARDVTENLMNESRLKDSETRFRALIENSADLLLMANAEGQFIYGSPSIKKLLGYSGKDYLYQNVFTFVHPSSIPDAQQLLQNLTSHPGKPFTIYLTLVHKNGKEVLVEGIATNLLQSPGINALVANFRDISERKKAERLIRESEDLYKNLFNKSPLPIWVCEAGTFRFLEANEAAVHHYGYSRKEFLNLTAFDITTPEDHEELRRLLTAGPRKVHHRLLRKQVKKNSEIIYVEVLTHFIKYKDKDSYLVVANDITEKVRLRHQLMEEKIYRQKEIMKASFDAQEKEREEIGRELHDNVTQILTTARLCLSCVDETLQQSDPMLQRSSDIIASAIEEIRKLSKSLTQSFHKEIGLQLSIEDLAENIRLAKKLQIVLEFSVPDEQLLDDKLKMTIFRIVQEQLNNILKHAYAKRVTISVVQTEEQVNLYITDDGKGFNMQEKRNGIGLMNILNRADIFNGRVKIDSSPGQGCRMWVSFKVAKG